MSPAPYVCRRLVEDVTAYLEGSLSAETVALVEAHLADCPHCTEYLAQMRRTIAMSGALGERRHRRDAGRAAHAAARRISWTRRVTLRPLGALQLPSSFP